MSAPSGSLGCGPQALVLPSPASVVEKLLAMSWAKTYARGPVPSNGRDENERDANACPWMNLLLG